MRPRSRGRQSQHHFQPRTHPLVFPPAGGLARDKSGASVRLAESPADFRRNFFYGTGLDSGRAEEQGGRDLSVIERGGGMISSKDQQVLHLLNRTAFGPAPGDFDRVRQTGLKAYLEEQLHPSQIDDSSVEERLRQLPTLTMSSKQLIENYPPRKVLKEQGGRPEPQNAGVAHGQAGTNSMKAGLGRNRQPNWKRRGLLRLQGRSGCLLNSPARKSGGRFTAGASCRK